VLGVWILNCACFLYISLFYVCLSCIVFRVSTFVVNKHLHFFCCYSWYMYLD